MDDNQLQSLLQQFKDVQKEISQSMQSSNARAAVAAEIAKFPPMGEGIAQLKHLETVDKAMTEAEKESRQLVTHSQKLVSHSDKLCNEMRTRRNAAREAEKTAQQAKEANDGTTRELQQVDAELTAARQKFEKVQAAFGGELKTFNEQRKALQQERRDFELEKAKTEARLAEQEKQLAAREEKLAKDNSEAMSRLETAFRDVKLGTENQSSALKKLQEDSSAIKESATKIPDVAQKLEDAAKERVQQPPMLTQEAVSQMLEKRFNKIEEMLNARPTGMRDLPDWSQQLGSQRTFAPQHTRQANSAANSSQPQGSPAANSSQPQDSSTPGNRASRKRQRTSTGASDESQANGGAAKGEQPAAQVVDADKEIDKFVADRVIKTKDPLDDSQLAEVKSLWGRMIFGAGFLEENKKYFVNRLANSVSTQDRYHRTDGHLREAAEASEPSCVISLWMRKGVHFAEREVQGPDGTPTLKKDDSVSCKNCKVLCLRVEKVDVPGGADKYRLVKRELVKKGKGASPP